MYCGDETGSFVGEVGSHLSRFGYGGDDSPKYCVPSYVATTTTTTNNGAAAVSTVKTVSVPTSCYNSRWARSEQVEFQSALRMAQVETNGIQPVVDPTRYLQQGDSIHSFDAYEHLWQSAFDALKVRDRLKHTKGGGRSDDTNNINNTAATGGDTTPASTTIRSSSTAFWDTKCIHPLLAVSPGCTYRVQNNQEGGGGNNNSEISNAAFQRKEMATMTEIFFEKLHAPALFIAPAPMLAAFSQGRQTALVVDIGAAGCRVTPVVDGILLKQSQRRNGRGGDWLGNVQWKALRELQKTVLLRPRYQQGKGFLKATATTTASTPGALYYKGGGRGIFHRWAMQDLMYEFRSSQHVTVPEWRVTNTVPFIFSKEEKTDNVAEADEQDGGGGDGDGGDNDDSSRTDKMEVDSPPTDTTTSATMITTTTSMTSSSIPKETTYELPDGTLIDLTTPVGRDLCRIPELLFTDDLPFLLSCGVMDESSISILNQHDTLSNLPLHQLIRNSLSAVGDVDVRKDLASSILLTGASSLIPNFEQRLSLQVGQIISTAYKPKVLASRQAVERSCASWIGGSILSSLGSFQQLWLGRSEYEEYGATLAIQRFP